MSSCAFCVVHNFHTWFVKGLAHTQMGVFQVPLTPHCGHHAQVQLLSQGLNLCIIPVQGLVLKINLLNDSPFHKTWLVSLVL